MIKNLNADKVFAWDNIPIRMIRHCSKSVALPLRLIFQSILTDGVFSLTSFKFIENKLFTNCQSGFI